MKAAFLVAFLWAALVTAVTNSGCDSIRNILAPVRNGNIPSGAQAVGLNNPNEQLVLTGGQNNLTTDLYVMNNATVIFVGNGQPISVSGSIFLMNTAKLYLTGAQVDFNQQYYLQYTVWALDQSVIYFGYGGLSQGVLEQSLMIYYSCNSAAIGFQHMTFPRTGAKPQLWVTENSTATVDNSIGGLFEITLSESAQITMRNGSAGIYFELTGNIPNPITLTSGSAITQQISLQDLTNQTMTVDITQVDVYFGLWLHDNTQVTLKDSYVLLFPSLTQGGSISNITFPGTFTTTYQFGTCFVHLNNTRIDVVNLYLSGNGAVVYNVTNSVIGEVSISENATATFINSEIDGSGGFITVQNTAVLSLLNSSIATLANIYDNGVFKLTNSQILSNPSKSNLQINAISITSLVLLEDTVWNPSYSFVGSGSLVQAALQAPEDNSAFNATNCNVTISGYALSTNAGNYQLELNGEHIDITLASGSTNTTVSKSWDACSSGSGHYELSLRVSTNSNNQTFAKVIRRLTKSGNPKITWTSLSFIFILITLLNVF